MATITKVLDFQERFNNHMGRLGQYTGPSSYVNGTGDSLTPEELGLGKLGGVFFEVAIDSSGTIRLVVYDVTNEVVLWYVPNTGAEVANGTDLSDFNARFLAVGK